MEDLPLTGERTVPGIPHENYWFRRHQVAYQHVSGLVSGHIVLDVGCGEGYGTAALATCAAEVIGIDYDARVVRHATATYRAPAFVIANLAALPIQGTSIDAVADARRAGRLTGKPASRPSAVRRANGSFRCMRNY